MFLGGWWGPEQVPRPSYVSWAWPFWLKSGSALRKAAISIWCMPRGALLAFFSFLGETLIEVTPSVWSCLKSQKS